MFQKVKAPIGELNVNAAQTIKWRIELKSLLEVKLLDLPDARDVILGIDRSTCKANYIYDLFPCVTGGGVCRHGKVTWDSHNRH